MEPISNYKFDCFYKQYKTGQSKEEDITSLIKNNLKTLENDKYLNKTDFYIGKSSDKSKTTLLRSQQGKEIDAFYKFLNNNLTKLPLEESDAVEISESLKNLSNSFGSDSTRKSDLLNLSVDILLNGDIKEEPGNATVDSINKEIKELRDEVNVKKKKINELEKRREKAEWTQILTYGSVGLFTAAVFGVVAFFAPPLLLGLVPIAILVVIGLTVTYMFDSFSVKSLAADREDMFNRELTDAKNIILLEHHKKKILENPDYEAKLKDFINTQDSEKNILELLREFDKTVHESNQTKDPVS